MQQPNHVYRLRPAAYAVVLNDNLGVAAVHEESGLFLPGGGLEDGEDAVAALHREVAEECARAVEIIAPLDAAVQFCVTARGEAFELQASFFLARFGDALDVAAQHQLTWLPTSPELPPFFHACHRWAVQQALQRLSPNK